MRRGITVVQTDGALHEGGAVKKIREECSGCKDNGAAERMGYRVKGSRRAYPLAKQAGARPNYYRREMPHFLGLHSTVCRSVAAEG